MGIEDQTDLFVGFDLGRTKEVRCRRCNEILSNARSIRNKHGAYCLKKIRDEERKLLAREPLLIAIDSDLLVRIHFWCDAMMGHTQSIVDQELIVTLYKKAKRFIYMSPVAISNEINEVIKLYYRLGMIRDDILGGLRGIASAAGVKIEV